MLYLLVVLQAALARGATRALLWVVLQACDAWFWAATLVLLVRLRLLRWWWRDQPVRLLYWMAARTRQARVTWTLIGQWKRCTGQEQVPDHAAWVRRPQGGNLVLGLCLYRTVGTSSYESQFVSMEPDASSAHWYECGAWDDRPLRLAYLEDGPA